MLTGVAILVQMPAHDFPGAGAFVLVVLVLIAAIFIRVYGWGNKTRGPTGHHSRRRTAHRSGRQTVHHASHQPQRDDNHGHGLESHKQPHQH
jgi:hypothetical protein